MGKNTKIVKEFDIKGKSSFSDYFLNREQTKFEKINFWFSVRWNRIVNWYYNTIRYFKNIYRFNKMMKKWYPWDYQSQVELFAYGLSILADTIEKYGHEVNVSRVKKVEAIRELVDLLNNGYEDEVNDKYLCAGEEDVITHVTEYEDGSTGFEVIDEKSKEIRKKSADRYNKEYKKARNAYFKRIFELVKGQDLSEKFDKVNVEGETLEEYIKRWDKFKEENFDGTGIEGWWD